VPIVQENDRGLTFRIKVIPRSRRSEIVGVHDEVLKIKIKAPPVDGKANEELVAFLARHLGVKPSSLAIVGGHTSPLKTIRVTGMEARTLSERLACPEKG